VFLVGGPAFSGTTLLALLLNQGSVVCLDEPDFHDPAQGHRGVPFLRELFPGTEFPPPPTGPLSWEATVDLVQRCEACIAPRNLGLKTCDEVFVEHARVYRARGYPVIAMIRDIRDALVRPLPPWVTEGSLNVAYRLIAEHRDLYDVWIRYETLVERPETVLAEIAAVLGTPLTVRDAWQAREVHGPMLKLDRHELLKGGRISRERVGIWRASGRTFEAVTHETARLLGYEPAGVT
jgi:hypothetical protein